MRTLLPIFAIIIVISFSNVVAIAGENYPKRMMMSDDHHNNHHSIRKKIQHSPKRNACNLCIDEDSIVGLPNKQLVGDWTCESMELEALEKLDFNDESCQIFQKFAKDCECYHMEELTKMIEGNKYLLHLLEKVDDEDKLSFSKPNNWASAVTNNLEKEKSYQQNNDTEIAIYNEEIYFADRSLVSREFAMTILSFIFLFLLIFSLSATTSLSQLYQKKPALSIGFLMQYVIIPMVGFSVVLAFKNNDTGFTQAMGLTLLIVASSPGGSYSNWWCSIFKADIVLSEAMTFVSTFLCLSMLPVNLIMYSRIAYGSDNHQNSMADGVDISILKQQEVVDYDTLFITLGLIVTALLTGHCTSYLMGESEKKAFKKISNLMAFWGSTGLIILFAFLSSVGTETNFCNQDWRIYFGIFIMNILAVFLTNIFSLSFLVAVLNEPECLTLTIECCHKNTFIAMSMALAMFPDPEEKAQAVAIVIIYTILQKITMLIYCLLAWKLGWTNAPPNENFWLTLTRSYGEEHKSHDDINNDRYNDHECFYHSDGRNEDEVTFENPKQDSVYKTLCWL